MASTPEIEPLCETIQPQPEPTVEPARGFVVVDDPIDVSAETIEAPQEAPPTPRPREVLVEIEEAEPAATLTPPLSGEAPPAAEPRSVPSVVVTPAIYATVGAAIERATGKDRWMVVTGVVAAAVIGGFIWLATLPAGGAVDLDAPPPPAQGLTVEVVDPTPAPSVETSTSPAPAAQVATAPAEPRAAAARPTPARSPETAPPPQISTPRPYIETAPLEVEPQTSSEPYLPAPDPSL